MAKKQRIDFASIYLFIVFLILYLPIFYLIYYSFNSGGKMYNFDSFTLEWYWELFGNTRMLIIVLNTIIIALLSAAFATIIGVCGAIGIWLMKNRISRQTVLSLNNILIVSPDVVIGASFLLLFTIAGIKLGFTSVLLAHIAFSVPIVVLMVLPKLQELPQSIIDAAQDLGASHWGVFTKVILPLITPGIFAGFFMALTYSLDDFAVTFFVTGSGFSTLSVEIYSMARRGVSLEINALSTILFVITILLVIGYYFIVSKQNNGQGARLGARK